MNQNPGNSRMNLIVIAVLIGLSLAVVYMVIRISEISSRIDLIAAEVSDHKQDHLLADESIASRLAELQSRIESLKQRPDAIQRITAIPSSESLAAIDTGYYELSTTTPYDSQSTEAAKYSISHVAVDINYEGFGTKLHLGIARGGFIPIGVYFDYNNDGEVDTEMVMDFIRDIPVIGRRLAKAYDPDVAQNLFSIFVAEHPNATYTSAEDMADDASESTSVLWKYVMDNYDLFAGWLGETASDANNGQPATGSR